MNRGYSTLLVMLVGFLAISLVLAMVVWRFWPKPNPDISQSPLPSLTPSPTPVADQILEWAIYQNEKLNIAFRYPQNWGALTPESTPKDDWLKDIFEAQINAKVYTFFSENKKIKKIWYHQPSGMIGFVEEGQKYTTIDNTTNSQETLKIINPAGKIISIYTIPQNMVEWYAEILTVNFSPNGDYVYFTETAYESVFSRILNVKTGKNILENYNIYLPASAIYEGIVWSPDNKTIAIKSQHSEFSGEGTDGLFVSDFDAPEKLNKVLSFSDEERLGESYLYDLRFLDENKLTFSVFSQKCTYSYETWKMTCQEKTTKKYEYDIQQHKLTENRSPEK